MVIVVIDVVQALSTVVVIVGIQRRPYFARYYRKYEHVVTWMLCYEASSAAAASIMFTFGLKSIASKRYS